MDVVLASHRVRNKEIRFHVVAFAFLENLVRPVLVLILDIEDRIDEVFALQHPEAILPSETCEYRAVVKRGLAVQVEFRGPPGCCAVFELAPEGMEVIPASLRPKCGEIFDLQVAGLFEIVVISDKVRVLLRKGWGWSENRKYPKEEKADQYEPTNQD
jgi:hypothetical protein